MKPSAVPTYLRTPRACVRVVFVGTCNGYMLAVTEAVHSMARAQREDLCSTLSHDVMVHGGVVHGLRWMCSTPCASTAFVQLHGDAETRMHPVGEYNELEPELSGSMAHGFALPSRTPARALHPRRFLFTHPPPPPSDPLSLFLRLSFPLCFHPVSPRYTLITSLSSRLILATP